MLNYVPRDPTKGARSYVLGMQARQLAASGNVNTQTELDLDVNVDDIGIIPKAVRSLVRVQVAFPNQDLKTIEDEIAWLSRNIYRDSLQISGSGMSVCATGTSRYAPTEDAVRTAQVILTQMEGLKALIDEDEPMFESKMKKAVKLEWLTDFPTGPPSIAQPSFEQYGDWLLEKGRYEEAREQFDKALRRMPRRAKSLEGKLTALKALEQFNKVADVREELRSIYAQADPEVKQLLDD